MKKLKEKIKEKIKRSFHFAKNGVTIAAETQDEAIQIFNKSL